MGSRQSSGRGKTECVYGESLLLKRYKQVNIVLDKSSQFPVIISPSQLSIAKWRRGEVIGQGTYSKVFRCTNLETGGSFAAKQFLMSQCSLNVYKQFFMVHNEVNILVNLDHPNIIKYYQTHLCADTRSVDIFVEFVPGKSLKSLLEEKKFLSEDKIKHYAYQILKALCYLHDSKVIHGDLKSANILVDQNDTVKIVDFGVSFHYRNSQDIPPRELIGSTYWMAPEVANCHGINLTSDVWSFGCVLIEMVTGKPPWSNLNKPRDEILKMIKTPKLLPQLPKCSDLLYEVIVSSLQRKRSLRPTPAKLIESEFFQQMQ